MSVEDRFPSIAAVLDAAGAPEAREVLRGWIAGTDPHTPPALRAADSCAAALTSEGFPIGESRIRDYRRAVRRVARESTTA